MQSIDKLFNLTGRHALITGAGGGIGLAIANCYVNAGAKVTLSDVSEVRLQAAISKMSGKQVSVHACNLSKSTQVNQLCQYVSNESIDILVCCAGMEGHLGPMAQCDDDQWQTLMKVNLVAAQKLSAAVVPHMMKQQWGRLIYVASIAGLRGNSALGLYGVAKAGLIQLARNYAVQCGPYGITANTIAPGLIDTPFSKGLQANTEFMNKRLQMTPLRRLGNADEVASGALFLATPAGGFTTGHTLVIDGGTLISDGN